MKYPPPQISPVIAAIRRLPHADITPNSAMEHARERAMRWAHQFVIDHQSHFEQSCCWTCAAYTFPAASAEVVELAAELIGWLFVFDDVHGEAVSPTAMMEMFNGCENLLRTGGSPSGVDRYQLALADLRQKLGKLASDAWLGRFAITGCGRRG